MDIMTHTLKVQFYSVDAHQSNPAECSIQDISKLLLHYIVKYGNSWCNFLQSLQFLFKHILIGHLRNISPYEIVYGRKLPVFSDLQLLSDNI